MRLISLFFAVLFSATVCFAATYSTTISTTGSSTSSPTSIDYAAAQAAAASGSMKDVESSAVFDLDATKSDSYGGSGQTWANLVSSPADSSSQTDYDFYLGADNTATTDDPTFNGSAGSAAAYWSVDGGDFFDQISNTNATFAKTAHQSGSDYWFAFAIRPANTTSYQRIMATLNSENGIVVWFNNSNGIRITIEQNNGGAAFADFGTVSAGTDYIIIVSSDISGSNIRYWINTTTASDATLTDPADPDADADGAIRIGASLTGSQKLASGTIIYAVSGGNGYLDNTAAAAIFAEYESRHARDYTP